MTTIADLEAKARELHTRIQSNPDTRFDGVVITYGPSLGWAAHCGLRHSTPYHTSPTAALDDLARRVPGLHSLARTLGIDPVPVLGTEAA